MRHNEVLIIKMKELITTNQHLHLAFQEQLIQYINLKTNASFMFAHLCLFHYEAFGCELDDDAVSIAAALELLILSFDIIDDLQDGDVDTIWSQDTAIGLNGAIALLFVAKQIVLKTSSRYKWEVACLIEKYGLDCINGQQQDLLNTARTEEAYLNMIRQKSGSLTALSCQLGVVLATGQINSTVARYAEHIGMIQQIKNDITDLKYWNGKNDIIYKKYSLSILFLFSQPSAVAVHLNDYYAGNTHSVNVPLLQKALIDSGAIQYALAIKNLLKLEALVFLKQIKMHEVDLLYVEKLMK
ncbi:polyprenyl synthetase family protein [Viridibacillus arvi]|uniref:polyprenyl synthetase family protein n=1 Tax=Viridibacillus arvi TaxID=263475 RepID=UPI003CFDC8BF